MSTYVKKRQVLVAYGCAPYAPFDQCRVLCSAVCQHTGLLGKPKNFPVYLDEPIEAKGVKRHGVYAGCTVHAPLCKASDEVSGGIWVENKRRGLP